MPLFFFKSIRAFLSFDVMICLGFRFLESSDNVISKVIGLFGLKGTTSIFGCCYVIYWYLFRCYSKIQRHWWRWQDVTEIFRFSTLDLLKAKFIKCNESRDQKSTHKILKRVPNFRYESADIRGNYFSWMFTDVPHDLLLITGYNYNDFRETYFIIGISP